MDQYWNAYSYCGADPVNYVDEWGLEGDGNYTVPGKNGNTEFFSPLAIDGISPTETGPGSVNNPNRNGDGLPTIVSNNSFVDNLRRAYERQQAAYGNEGVEADPFIPSPIIFGTLARNAGKAG